MTTQADDGKKRIEKYLLENATPEANPKPKDKGESPSQEKPEARKDYEKNDDSNEYDITEDDSVDDKNW